MNKWIQHLFGLDDKTQNKETAETNRYALHKSTDFGVDMGHIQNQVEIVRNASKKTISETLKLTKIVDDVTAKLAVVTGKLKIKDG